MYKRILLLFKPFVYIRKEHCWTIFAIIGFQVLFVYVKLSTAMYYNRLLQIDALFKKGDFTLDDTLKIFAKKIGLNPNEAYLNLELNNGICILSVIERGTGGCTFPQMETMLETPLDDISLFSSLTESNAFLQKILDAKARIRKENPHFFDTVFYSTEKSL